LQCSQIAGNASPHASVGGDFLSVASRIVSNAGKSFPMQEEFVAMEAWKPPSEKIFLAAEACGLALQGIWLHPRLSRLQLKLSRLRWSCHRRNGSFHDCDGGFHGCDD
jgi:hypothetical protein